MALTIVPVTFRQACAFIAAHHRHHKPPRGMRFCLGVDADGKLAGVAPSAARSPATLRRVHP